MLLPTQSLLARIENQPKVDMDGHVAKRKIQSLGHIGTYRQSILRLAKKTAENVMHRQPKSSFVTQHAMNLAETP